MGEPGVDEGTDRGDVAADVRPAGDRLTDLRLGHRAAGQLERARMRQFGVDPPAQAEPAELLVRDPPAPGLVRPVADGDLPVPRPAGRATSAPRWPPSAPRRPGGTAGSDTSRTTSARWTWPRRPPRPVPPRRRASVPARPATGSNGRSRPRSRTRRARHRPRCPPDRWARSARPSGCIRTRPPPPHLEIRFPGQFPRGRPANGTGGGPLGASHRRYRRVRGRPALGLRAPAQRRQAPGRSACWWRAAPGCPAGSRATRTPG